MGSKNKKVVIFFNNKVSFEIYVLLVIGFLMSDGRVWGVGFISFHFFLRFINLVCLLGLGSNPCLFFFFIDLLF